MKNTSLSTEELLAETKHMRLPTIIELIDMSETTHQKVSKVDIDEAIFQPFPSEIVFQNFKPFETYQVNITMVFSRRSCLVTVNFQNMRLFGSNFDHKSNIVFFLINETFAL